MAVMTVDEARRYAASVSPQTDGVERPRPGGGGSGDGSAPYYLSPPDPTKPPPSYVPPGGAIDPATGSLIAADQSGNIVVIAAPGELFQMGDTVYRWSGHGYTQASAAETRAYLGGDASGGSAGRSTFDTGPGYLDLANRQFGFQSGPQFQEGIRQFNQTSDRSEQAARASTGLSLADLARGLSQDYYQLAKDPGNFPALAAAYSGLEGQAGQGSPLSTLLGEGFRIKPDAMSNPLGDQRFRDLLDQLYQRAGGMNADFGAVRDAYARDPQAAATFFAQKPEDLARMFGQQTQPMAAGGAFIANRPMRLQDLTTGDTAAVLGEQGKPEQVSVTPLQAMASGQSYGAMASGGSAVPNEYSPAEATSVALGKSLKGLGYVPGNILDVLGSGKLLGPNMMPDWLLKRLPPSLVRLLQADVLSNLGSAGAGDYWAERQRYVPQGFDAFAGGVRR